MTFDDTPGKGDTRGSFLRPRTPISEAEGLLAIEPVLVAAGDQSC